MRVFITLCAMVGCTVAANILMKKGAMASEGSGSFFCSIFNWQIVAALTCFAAGALLYVLLLRWLPLNVAQSFAAAQFVGVILASMLVLAEPISLGQWLGISLITLGIAVIGLTTPLA